MILRISRSTAFTRALRVIVPNATSGRLSGEAAVASATFSPASANCTETLNLTGLGIVRALVR